MSEAGAPYPTELTDKACTYSTVHRLYSTPRKKKKGGVRDGLKRWKAAVGSEKKNREKERRRQECVLCTGKTDEGVARKISTLL